LYVLKIKTYNCLTNLLTLVQMYLILSVHLKTIITRNSLLVRGPQLMSSVMVNTDTLNTITDGNEEVTSSCQPSVRKVIAVGL